MEKKHIYSIVILCLAVSLGLYGCAPMQINGGGTLPSTSGNIKDKANFGFSANNCNPRIITGDFNYHDKNALGLPDGGVKLNGEVLEVAKCSEGDNSSYSGITCGICNLQFCNGCSWPDGWETCVSDFLTDPMGYCQDIEPIPPNLYGVVFRFTSTNPRYPGSGAGVACITDNGQGSKAIDKDKLVLIIATGQYAGYVNQGPVKGNISSAPCCHDLCQTGFPPVPSCDPCIADVCAINSHCCTTGWDSSCIEQAKTTCGLVCAE